MATRLLIDAAHPEETRVVVVSGTRLDEFDFEASTKKQLKGNIYLATVARVEPSLQAAFVEYGGNRHGFLAFGDIHPDYYQIPVADRQKLIEERAAEEAARAAAEEAEAELADAEGAPTYEPAKPESPDDVNGNDIEAENFSQPEAVGGDEVEELRLQPNTRHYKIQEVIKRRQVLLVQVVKEERGTKGAALTTYLSLAGRYGVLMPNTARGGGVSRKIVSTKDRKRLRDIIDSLEVAEGMGLIVRTAGQQRTKADIRRDYNYLLRVWDTVRQLTFQSAAPTLVYEEADLIKRAIRDLYSSDITEVLIEGEGGYKSAKGIMKMLMPSHAKRVQKYDDRIPLFHRYQVEQQLDRMHNPTVRLRSGGYIVINSTEALVAIDVNSGRSTRERNIESTALKTNLEAAQEVALQLRLRDLAGLIVVDFIDMDVSRNNRAVERKLKESLKIDRARIQLGRISAFGLLELSRQRMRPSLLESSTEPCSTCGGIGLVRSTESAALHVMRMIEDEGIHGETSLTVEVPASVASYLLNQKRASLSDLEQRFGLGIAILPDPDLTPPAYNISYQDKKTAEPVTAKAPVADKSLEEAAITEHLEPAEAVKATKDEGEHKSSEESGEDKATKRRRRGKRGGRRRRKNGVVSEAPEEFAIGSAGDEVARVETIADELEADVLAQAALNEAQPGKKPTRRRTRARSSSRTAGTANPKKPRTDVAATTEPPQEEVAAPAKSNGDDTKRVKATGQSTRKPRRRRRRRPETKITDDPVTTDTAATDRDAKAPIAAEASKQPQPEPELPPAPSVPDPEGKPARRGWWQFGR